MSTPLPATEEDIDIFLAAFEDGTLPKERWTHAAHLLGGACYVYQLGAEAALNHMRICVPRYNIAVGGENTFDSGYHETVTIFWIKLLAAFLAEQQPVTRAEFAARAVAHFASPWDVYGRYYSYNVIRNTEARAHWRAPDLLPLP